MASVDMSNVDGDAWYGITEWRVNWTSAMYYNGNGDLYFGTYNNGSNGMYWQIYELPDRRFQFRSRNSNTLKQLGICYDSAEVSSSLTQPCMEESSAEESQQWTIEPWGDGSYKIQNVANGTGLNMDWHPGGPGFMSPDTAIAPYQPAQHWAFTSIGAVRDGLYSTSIVSESAAATTAAGSGTSTPASASATATGTSAGSQSSGTDAASQQSGSSSSGGGGGLSSGAAAGIGVGVAIAVIAVLALGFLSLRRRKRQPKEDHLQELPGTSSGYAAGNAQPGKTYEKTGPVYEAPAQHQAYEMATTPSELPGSNEHGYRK